ncbi:fungal-specific transcription factor domain-containing protein [Fusarium oxysporum]|nr:fungal-specific transcription factor domain-containing protein [Fusarium oxysporum]
MVSSRRKRTNKACDRCRRRKERCDGTTPCARCQKQGLECSFRYAGKPLGRPRKVHHHEGYAVTDLPELLGSDADFLNVGRIHALEHIVRHYTGIDHLTTDNLEDHIVGLPRNQGMVPHHRRHSKEESIGEWTIQPSGSPDTKGLSHSQFLRLLFDKFDHLHPGPLEEPTHAVSDQRNFLQDDVALDLSLSQLLSHDITVVEAASVFPAFEAASRLMSIFFEFGQMNYFYIDELDFQSSLAEFYNKPFKLTAQDAPWVCVVLMVFAVGAQFSHLKGEDRSSTQMAQTDHIWLDDALALMYFRQASKLVPDVLAIGSLQSVQALLLIGFYVLPLGNCSVASTYLSIGLRMATDCCLQLDNNISLTAREIEVRRRVWCTAFILERRNSVYHGKYLSTTQPPLQSFDMLGNVDMSAKRIDTHQNTKTMVVLTNMLQHVWYTMNGLLDLEATHQIEKLQDVLDTRDQLLTYWNSLPDNMFGRDLCPHKPLFRHNIYLALSYHSIHIFIGRPFILERLLEDTIETGLLSDTKSKLSTSCIESALATVDLCQRIKNQSGVSRSSYIEFTSCHAAVSALVAASILNQTSQWNRACRQGFDLLRAMLDGVFSQSSGRKDLERLEYAVDQLLDHGLVDIPEEMSCVTYQDFLQWGSAFMHID